MMMRDLLADVIGKHKYDLDASIASLGTGKQAMVCTCGKSWPDDEYSDRMWDLHIADALLAALAPTPSPQPEATEHVPLWPHEEEETR